MLHVWYWHCRSTGIISKYLLFQYWNKRLISHLCCMNQQQCTFLVFNLLRCTCFYTGSDAKPACWQDVTQLMNFLLDVIIKPLLHSSEYPERFMWYINFILTRGFMFLHFLLFLILSLFPSLITSSALFCFHPYFLSLSLFFLSFFHYSIFFIYCIFFIPFFPQFLHYSSFLSFLLLLPYCHSDFAKCVPRQLISIVFYDWN